MCQTACIIPTDAMFDMISICLWPRIYTRANTESYKELRDKNRVVLAGQYFTVLNGLIFYGINQAMR